jgi:FkbM family methyltransferase
VDSRPYAVGSCSGIVTVPGLDYTKTASFGSLPIFEFADEKAYGDIGQEIDHERSLQVPMIAIDDLHVNPSLIKIDTEGMELEVLKGAEATIDRMRPVVYFEHIKADKDALVTWIEARDYLTYVNGCDYACLPREKRHMFPQFEYEAEKVTEPVGVFGG